MKTVEPKLPETATNIYNGILKQGYVCDNAACNRDSVKDFKVNGHTVGQTWKYLEKDLQITPLDKFDKPETFEEFSDRLTGYMCAIEGDLPPDEWHTEFKEKIYTALKSSTNTNIVSPEIKGVVQSNKYMTKKELWALFLAEKRGVGEEERKKKEKKEKEERERKEREKAEKERVEKEKAEKEKREKEKREQEVKNKEIDEHAKKYGLSYNGSYFVFWSSTEMGKIPSYYRNALIGEAERALHNIYKEGVYDINKDFENLVRKKAPLEDILASPSLWGGGFREAREFALDYDDDQSYTESTQLLKKQLQGLLDKVHTYNNEVEEGGFANVFTDLLYGFGRAVICKRTQEKSPFTNLEDRLFSGECNKYVDVNSPIDGFKKFIKEFNFSTWMDGEECYGEECYGEESMKLFIDNLEEIKNQIGVGSMKFPEVSQETKDIVKEGARRGTIKAATKKGAEQIAALCAKQSGKKGAALKKYGDTLAEFFKTDIGQAMVSITAGQVLPMVGEKFGKAEALKSLAKELNIQGVEIVTEQVAGAALDVAGMGIGMLADTFKGLVENEEPVDVTPVGALSSGERVVSKVTIDEKVTVS